MHETADDLSWLQGLLDASYERAGAHMRTIFQPVTLMSAAEVVSEMRGVQVLDLATVTASGAPRVAPVDGLFYRGRFHFGSSRDSVRIRHIRARPRVSAAHTRGEDLTIIVHGTAAAVDVGDPANAGFRRYLIEVYPDWEAWYPGEPPPYMRIDPERMYAARVAALRVQGAP